MPRLKMAPGAIGLTGLSSFFWLQDPPQPISATAQAGPVTVTAEARPAEFSWDFGDGAHRSTWGPGRAWRPRRGGTIAHMYESRGVFDIGIDVVWEARWRIGGGAWQTLGSFTTSDSATYPVREVVAFLTRA